MPEHQMSLCPNPDYDIGNAETIALISYLLSLTTGMRRARNILQEIREDGIANDTLRGSECQVQHIPDGAFSRALDTSLAADRIQQQQTYTGADHGCRSADGRNGHGVRPDKIGHRSAAILAADIAGYSALMSTNEETTFRDYKEHFSRILPMISDFGGRIINVAGDGFLSEFFSALNAVSCAVAIQETMAMRNAELESIRRMQLRIGVNQGELIFDDESVYGNVVNIAARLQAIAQPGTICISSKVYDEVQGKLHFEFPDCGKRRLKNIVRAVHVYEVVKGCPDVQREDNVISLPRRTKQRMGTEQIEFGRPKPC